MGQPESQNPSPRPEISRTVSSAEVRIGASFSGPLPPPSLLKGYEEVCPGAAERIISMAEQQGRHRQAMEKESLEISKESMKSQFMEARVGQVCALLVTIAFVVAGVWVALSGSPWPGTILGGGGVALQALVVTFVRGRSTVSSETKPPTKEASTPKKRRGK